jgi:hypothetical protein
VSRLCLETELITAVMQIWFQNRRQNDRRKSRPLEPYEFLAPRATGLESSQSSLSAESVTTESEPLHASDLTQSSEGSIDGPDPAVLTSADASFITSLDRDGLIGDIEITSYEGNSQANELLPSSQTSKISLNDQQEGILTPNNQGLGIVDSQTSGRKRAYSMNNDQQLIHVKSAQSRRSALAPQKSPPSLRISMSFDGEALVRRNTETTPSPPKVRSGIRISLSSDGEALIRTVDEPSPSKNRLRLVPTRTPRLPRLRRSYSAVNALSSKMDMGNSESEGKLFGRSRDARTWELYCDTDARSALSPSVNIPKSLHGEVSGSYRSLSRSSSSMAQINVLGTNPTLANRMVPVEQGEKRRKLSRAVSSLGRLETGQKNTHLARSSLKKPSIKESNDDVDLQVGDSDKENWLPGTQTSGVRRQRVGVPSQRSALTDGARTQPDRGARATGSDECQDVHGGMTKGWKTTSARKVDEEAMVFMPTSDGSDQNEDLDCIQGLLSLSQGAWS